MRDRPRLQRVQAIDLPSAQQTKQRHAACMRREAPARDVERVGEWVEITLLWRAMRS